MPTYPNWLAGNRVTAGQLNAGLPIQVVKAADQSVTSSTVLVNDNSLVVPVIANATYAFICDVNYEGGTQGASDLKWQWSIPSCTMRYGVTFVGAGGGVTVTAQVGADIVVAGTAGAGVRRSIQFSGTIIMGSTPGNIQFTWAQNTISATPTIVHAQSYLQFQRTP